MFLATVDELDIVIAGFMGNVGFLATDDELDIAIAVSAVMLCFLSYSRQIRHSYCGFSSNVRFVSTVDELT